MKKNFEDVIFPYFDLRQFSMPPPTPTTPILIKDTHIWTWAENPEVTLLQKNQKTKTKSDYMNKKLDTESKGKLFINPLRKYIPSGVINTNKMEHFRN